MNHFSLNHNVCICMLVEYITEALFICFASPAILLLFTSVAVNWSPNSQSEAILENNQVPGQSQNRSHDLYGGKLNTYEFTLSHPLSQYVCIIQVSSDFASYIYM